MEKRAVVNTPKEKKAAVQHAKAFEKNTKQEKSGGKEIKSTVGKGEGGG
jgi:hypothetical protein